MLPIIERSLQKKYQSSALRCEPSESIQGRYLGLAIRRNMIIKSKAKTSSELRKELRNLKPYQDDLILGDRAIMKTSSSYGVRGVDDHDDPMTDYSAYIYGYKEKWIVDRAINEKRIIPTSVKSTPKKTLKLKFKK